MCDKALEQAAKESAEYACGSATEEQHKRDTSSAFPDVVDVLEASSAINESGESPGGGGGAGKAQLYIEVDAGAMANLKAGTQYTLVPVDAEQRAAAAAAAAAANDHSQQQQQLAWCQPMDGSLTEDDVSGGPVDGVTKEELSADTFTLDQSIMHGFGTTTKAESSDTSPVLDTDFQGVTGDGSEKMTYTPLISVTQQQQQHHHQQQQQDAAVAAAAAAASHMHAGGYEQLRYRHPSPSMFGAPPPHGLQQQAPYLVHSHGAWAPYTTQATPQAAQAYLSPVLPPPAPGTPGSSSMSAASTSSGTPDTSMTLGSGDEVPSPPDYSHGAGGEGAAGGADLLGVARVANMGQIQQMVGPLDNMPYYMPFNGRENHNEKERKRRTRIKNACQTLRSLVPGLSEKTDKATVFEFTVQYLLHLRRHLGVRHDKEFMEKYSPY